MAIITLIFDPEIGSTETKTINRSDIEMQHGYPWDRIISDILNRGLLSDEDYNQTFVSFMTLNGLITQEEV